jgi:hypothetical protein
VTGVPRFETTSPDFVMVRAALVRRLGGMNNAAVWTRIDWRCAGRYDVQDGYWRGSWDVIAEEIGLTPRQVQYAVAALQAGGFLEVVEQRVGGNYDRTKSYRTVYEDEPSHSTQVSNGDDDSVGSDQRNVSNHSLSKTSKTLSTTRRKTGGGRAKGKFVAKEPDDALSAPDDDEPPALGADKTRQSARSTPDSTDFPNASELASRLAAGLARDGVQIPTNQQALRDRLRADRKAGLDPALQVSMVDLFLRNRAQYTFNDRVPPWQTFLAQRTAIAVDAKRVLDAQQATSPKIDAEYAQWLLDVASDTEET